MNPPFQIAVQTPPARVPLAILDVRGEVGYAGVVRDLPQPYLREIGSQSPADFPEEKQAEMIAFTARVLQAMGFTDGSFHVEIKYTSEGPRLIEVNARIGGLSVVITHTDFLMNTVDPHVIHKKVYVTAGQTVIGPDRGVPDALGEIIVAADSIEAASAILNGLLAQIQFPINPA